MALEEINSGYSDDLNKDNGDEIDENISEVIMTKKEIQEYALKRNISTSAAVTEIGNTCNLRVI